MSATTELHEIARTDLRQAQRIAASAIGESGLRRFLEHKGRQACIQRARTRPLPGAAADAFLNGGIKMAGRVIHEVMPVHLKCLQAVNSPVLRLIENAVSSKDKQADVDFEPSEERELCYIFTADPEKLEDTPKGERVELIKSESKRIFGKCSAAEINMTVVAVVNQFHRHIQTSVKFAGEMEASGDVRFFREPPEKP